MKRNITIVVVSVIAALMVIGAVPVVGASDPSPQIIEVSYPSLVYDGQKATITVTAKNNGGFSDDGYISVSFPNDEDILESDVYGTGNDYNNLYPKGYWPLWNSTDQQMISIDPLVELHDTNWGGGQEESITMSISPTGAEQIVFYVRVALKNSEGTFIHAPASSSYIDQQGWCVNRYTIDVVYPPPLLWKYKTDGRVYSVDISSDGNYIAAGSYYNYVYLFDKAGNQLWKEPTEGNANYVSISSDGNYIAVGSNDWWPSDNHSVYLFDRTGKQLWNKTSEEFVRASISSSGNYVVARFSDNYVYLFDKAGNQILNEPTDGIVNSVSISSDGNYIAAGTDDNYVYLFDKAGNQILKEPTDEHIHSVRISSDGNYIAAGSIGWYPSSTQAVYLFDKVGNQLWKYQTDGHHGNSISISSDGNYIASGTSGYEIDNSINYFDRGGSKLWNYSVGTNKRAYVSVSDDGNYIAAGSRSEYPITVYFLNKAGVLLWKENYFVNSDAVRISSDGNYIAVGSGNYICLFDAFAELQMPLEYVPTSIATGDLNSNGLNDTVSSGTNVWNGNPVMNLHNQQSDHTFAEQEFFDDEVIASLSVGDLDGNGFDDMTGLYGTTDGFVYTGVRVWHQNEFGFGSYVDYTFGDLEPKSLSVDDLNDDELDDIAIIAGDNVYIFYQQTDYTFRNTPDYTLIWEYGSWPESIITGDINNDGLNDIAVGHFGPSFSGVGISFFHQTEGHSFVAAPFDFGDINSMLSCSIGDLNNDGLNDIAIARWGVSGSDILIYYQQESHTFNIEEYPPHGEDADAIILTDPPWSISVCDLNDDELDDIAVANGPQGIGGNGGLSIYYQTVEDRFFHYYPTTAFPKEETELTVIVDLTQISMNIGDPVQWYITTPSGETITGESDTLKCCRVGGLYDAAYYDFPEYGTYTIKVEFPWYPQYAEWDVEVCGPTGAIIGEVTNPTDDPIENVDVYLYDSEDEYKVLDFIDEWRSDPRTSVPSYISTTKTDSTGKYQITEIIPGSYLVLAVPQVDMGYSPNSSEVFSIKKDETEIINLQLTPRYLNFDKVMGVIKTDSKNIVDEDTGAAAEVYVKGWNEFTEHDLPENLFWSAVGGITSAIEIYRGDPKTVGLAVAKLAEELGVTLVGIPLLEEAAKVQWQKEGPGDYELAKEAAIEVKNLNWMRDFEYAAEGSDIAEEEGYIKRTNIYPETVTSIDRSFEDYLDLAYQEPAEGFDSSEVKAILQQQEEMLRDAKGFVITPQGNIFNLKETIIHKEGYEGAKTIADTAGIAGKTSTVLSAAGLAISIGTSWTIAGVGVGAAVSGFGAVGGLASATIETIAIELMADEWGNTQLYWAKDLGEIQEVNRDIVEWLDEEMQHPTDFKNIDGEIISG
jgi:WD40 repeat protein